MTIPQDLHPWPFRLEIRSSGLEGELLLGVGGQWFSLAEWDRIERQRRAMMNQLVAENGHAWVNSHRTMLCAQWAYAISIGLVGP